MRGTPWELSVVLTGGLLHGSPRPAGLWPAAFRTIVAVRSPGRRRRWPRPVARMRNFSPAHQRSEAGLSTGQPGRAKRSEPRSGASW